MRMIGSWRYVSMPPFHFARACARETTIPRATTPSSIGHRF